MGFLFKKNSLLYGGLHASRRKPNDAQKQAYFAHEQHRHYTNNVTTYGRSKQFYAKPTVFSLLKAHWHWISAGVMAVLATVALLALPSTSTVPSPTVPNATAAPVVTAATEAASENSEPAHIHQFTPASCMLAATCSVCGETEGDILNHSFSDNVCIHCGEEEPTVWIPQYGERYHTNPDCSNMIDPSEVPISTAIAQGFTPCSHCY